MYHMDSVDALMDSPPPPVSLHSVPTGALQARRFGKPNLSITLVSDNQAHQDTAVVNKKVEQPSAPFDGDAKDREVDATQTDVSSSMTLEYRPVVDSRETCLPFGQKRCVSEATTPVKRHKMEHKAQLEGGSHSNSSLASFDDASNCSMEALENVNVRVKEWTLGAVCTPPSAIDSAFGDFPFSALSAYSDNAALESPGVSLSQQSSASIEMIPSLESSLPEYFGNTSIPRDGWMQTCRCCSQWTGATMDVQDIEIPCCRRCQQRYHRLKSTPKDIEGKRDPLSCYVAKTLDEAGVYGYPGEAQMPAVLEKAIIDLDVVWSEYLASAE